MGGDVWGCGWVVMFCQDGEVEFASLHTRKCVVVFARLGSDAGTEAAAARGHSEEGIDDPFSPNARLA